MKVKDMIDLCARLAHDPQKREVEDATWMTFLQSASYDLRSSGWLRRQDDDVSLTVAANTYTYTVPSGFAYIKELRQEEIQNAVSAYVREIPRGHWDIHQQGGAAVIFFLSLGALENGKHIMVVGQKRPTIYATGEQTIDPGMEAFVRDRALAYAMQFMGQGQSEFAKWRQIMAGQKMQSSEAFLRRHPQEFRVQPNSIIVPGAE